MEPEELISKVEKIMKTIINDPVVLYYQRY